MAATDSGSKKRPWPMIGMAIVTAGALGLALFKTLDGDITLAMPAKADTAEVIADPVFLPIEPFTANLADDEAGSRLVYAGVTLKLSDEKSLEAMEKRMPQLRSRLLTLFSGKSTAELSSPEDKEILVEEITEALQPSLEAGAPAATIDDVLFTEFIIQ